MCEQQTTTNEKLMRVNIKLTAKGEPYYDVTARGNTKEEVSKNLNEIVQIAQEKIKEIKADERARKFI